MAAFARSVILLIVNVTHIGWRGLCCWSEDGMIEKEVLEGYCHIVIVDNGLRGNTFV
jgi:hypothetical protein